MSYEKLREECNRRLPERDIHAPATIADVLRVLPHNYSLSGDGSLWVDEISDEDELDTRQITQFTLAAPLSDPSNADACEAVLKLLADKCH